VRTVATLERVVSEVLRASGPVHLKGLGVKDAKRWVREHLERDTAEQARFPDQPFLPWTNGIAYNGWERDTFFVVLILQEDVIELFCGTGYWPDVRTFGEGEAESVPAAELHREWAARFTVPYPPLMIGRGLVKKWLGREWSLRLGARARRTGP